MEVWGGEGGWRRSSSWQRRVTSPGRHVQVGAAAGGGVLETLTDLAGEMGARFAEMDWCSTIDVGIRLALAAPEEEAVLPPNMLADGRRVVLESGVGMAVPLSSVEDDLLLLYSLESCVASNNVR